MSEQKKSRGAAGALVCQLVLGIFMLAVTVVILYYQKPWSSEDRKGLVSAVIFLGVCLLIYLQYLIHSLGLLFFGKISGCRLLGFRFGPWMWVKKKDGMYCQKVPGFGKAACTMVPPEGENPALLWLLGGGLFCFLVSGIFLVPVLVSGDRNLITCLCSLGAFLGFVYGLRGIFPFPGDGENSAHLFWLLHGRPELKKRWRNTLLITEQAGQDVRLRDMPEDLFSLTGEPEQKNSVGTLYTVYYCQYQMDKGNYGEAEQLLQKLLESGAVPASMEYLVKMDLLTCKLLQIQWSVGESENPAENVPQEELERIYNESLMREMQRRPQSLEVLRTRYLVALLWNKNLEDAEAIKERFEEMASAYPHSADAQSEREYMEAGDGIFAGAAGGNTGTDSGRVM
ncbi:MAG: hypothetical protein J1F02_10925 [Lachnospiraceae bacterium]|nr:hypothetical protein [Lachnospiraceae bacterium]